MVLNVPLHVDSDMSFKFRFQKSLYVLIYKCPFELDVGIPLKTSIFNVASNFVFIMSLQFRFVKWNLHFDCGIVAFVSSL